MLCKLNPRGLCRLLGPPQCPSTSKETAPESGQLDAGDRHFFLSAGARRRYLMDGIGRVGTVNPRVGLQPPRSTRAMASPANEWSRSSRRSLFRTALAAGAAYAAGAGRAGAAPRSSEHRPEAGVQDREPPRGPTPIVDTHIHLVRG